MIRKLLALVLSMMMIVSAVPVQVLAAPSAFTGFDSAMEVPMFEGFEEEAEISAENETETTSNRWANMGEDIGFRGFVSGKISLKDIPKIYDGFEVASYL